MTDHLSAVLPFATFGSVFNAPDQH
jgi:hypothetical protein